MPTSKNIIPAQAAHTEAILQITVDAGMFQVEEIGALREILEGFHAAPDGNGQHLVVAVDASDNPDNQTPTGAAYFGPNHMSDNAWDLWMIAVPPERQGQGIGCALVAHAESVIQQAGGRLLIIETNSTEQYEKTRKFYAQRGYAQVGCIPDFYGNGEDKVIFCKRLFHASTLLRD
ncbi:MAG: GNAT family N-acetyltransferase [Burkholderiaceae bacterium]|nr:GNAT family N-acetyltransferase [Burkholderiaceae bacterium]